ncbi:putative exonuclease GOR [Indicator indicator]|uniref:putative exonuclease GOR n=1 Tax=Indicator indicator TaxID=1002788 RepID=UPI0023DE82A1|nr:putative exonuclease GOR [Indicator indicator]
MKKGIWKQGNAETKTVVKTIVHKSANEDCENSRRVTRSVLCTSDSSKDEATTERPYLKRKTEESQRIEENEDDDSLEDTCTDPIYSLSKKQSRITLSSPRGQSTETSESDDPLEECLRIFEEFEKEKQKEACDQQANRGKVLGTEGNVPEQSTNAAHSAKLATFEAMTEERSVFHSCSSKVSYLNYAARTLKKLKEHGSALYELLKDYILTKEQLNENNFPRPNPEKSGSAILPKVVKGPVHDALKRLCCRCGTVYAVNSSGEHTCEEECNYHSGRVVEQKVPGGMEKHSSCCERSVGSAGCQIAKLHVHNGRSDKLEGFVKTLSKSLPHDGTFGVYALDCEMCYTTHGLELTRVAVVDAMLRVVYDTFVKPDGKIVDCDRRLSGVTEADLKNTTTSLQNVQAVLINLFNEDTILIGHKLEKSFIALKLIHDTVVDTSVVFPHHLSLPNKRTLGSLIAEYLRKIHQDDDVNGHNSKEEATACMELILWKVKEDNKKMKWL